MRSSVNIFMIRCTQTKRTGECMKWILDPGAKPPAYTGKFVYLPVFAKVIFPIIILFFRLVGSMSIWRWFGGSWLGYIIGYRVNK